MSSSRRNKKKEVEYPLETPMEIPLEGPPIPLEGVLEREDAPVREDAPAREDTPRATLPPAREEVPIPPSDPTPPQLNKTQSEIATQDHLITSFVNGAKSRDIEVVFAFDTTGSMSSYIVEVRKKLKETCAKLMKDIPFIKIGIMAFGDYCDQSNYVVKSTDLSTDTEKLLKWIETVSGTGGGDAPEAYEWALRQARSLNWTPTANKAFVIIGDASPHPPSYTDQNVYWRDEVQELTKQGVKVYGVLCNSTLTPVRPFYEEIAEISGGVFLTLKHLQLITDMFLAVCYREFGAEHLETFRTEVAEGGRMDEGMKVLFTQLGSDGAVANPQHGKRSTESWYDRSRDTTTRPCFSYNGTIWKSFTGNNPPSPTAKPTPPSPVTKPTSPPAKKTEKKRKDSDGETSPSPSKKKKSIPEKPKPKEKKVKKETKAKKPSSPKPAAKKEKKVEKKDVEMEEEEKKTLKKAESIIVGSGEWKRDRHGRMASLHD